MINQETVQRILDASHIEEVIGEFVSLKKRGSNHIGCCPFHNEKTPSFYVSPSKGIFKCFGCGEAGDVVRFLMKHEHYTYPEALHYLAKKYNITIEEEELTQEQRERNTERDALFHVTEFAQKYFADILYNDEMGRAIGLAYFHHRGLSDEIIKSFGLGYCLDDWQNFTDYAIKNGYSANALVKSGLSIQNEENGRRYDRFRGRVMFPIYSISGRVKGFSGRVLVNDKKAAKYVNSPDSDIYNKTNSLYGLFQAKNAISKENKCYLVEGNVDVLSMHQSGVKNTVASCGTSLTAEQVRLIKRYTPNITVLYDGDAAGIKAALRAVNILFEEGCRVRVVLFPDGEDPDSYAQKYGSAQLQDYLSNNEQNFVKFKTQLLLDDIKHDPIRKAEVVKEIVSTIALVPDMLERTEYIAQCAYLLNVPEQTLSIELANAIVHRKKEEIKRQSAQQVSADHQAGVSSIVEVQTTVDSATPEGLPEAGQGVVETPIVQPVRVQPSSAKERHIIELLLNYGYKAVPMMSDEGVPTQEAYPLASLVVADVQGDNITFDNPVYQRIFDLYAEAESAQRAVETSLLIASDDEELRTTVVSLMVDTEVLSPVWKEKGIIVALPEHRLYQDVMESLLNLKLDKVNHRIEEIDRKLRTCGDEIDLGLLLNEKSSMIDLRCQIGRRLNMVVN